MTSRKQHFANKKALTSRTPTWAQNMVGITILVTSVATFIVASDTSIPAATAVKIGIYLKGADMLVAGIAKLWGVTYEKVNE